MTQRPFEIPSWAPVAAIAAIVVWAVSIWWMVANLEAGRDTGAIEDGVNALQSEVETLAARMEALTEEVDGLRDERAALQAQLDEMAEQALVAAVQDTTAEDAEPAVEEHPLFTNGKDLFNCRAFSSFEEAQEALRVNGPGDPNRIDTNGNGIACEDVNLPRTAASTSDSPTSTVTSAQQGIVAQ